MSELPLVIYHAGCRDGFCAAWVARRALGDAELYPAYYDQHPPIVSGRAVYILDFSYPRPILERLAGEARSLLVLDHHKTAQEALEGLSYAVFDMNRSGAGLSWDHFFPGLPRPWIVDYVEDRDLWRKKLPRAEEVSAYTSILPFTLEAWEALPGSLEPSIIIAGSAILRKTQQYVHEVARNALRIEFPGEDLQQRYDVPCVNAPQTDISDLLHHLAEGEPFAVGWWQRGDGCFQYSLRSPEGGVDVSRLARLYGGGGHRSAAGFSCAHPLHFEWSVRPAGGGETQ